MIDFKNQNLNQLINSGKLKIVEEHIQFLKLQSFDEDTFGKYYFFIKPKSKINHEGFWLRELLGEKIANYFNKKSAHYIRVLYKGELNKEQNVEMSGVITESLHKPNKNYITGKKLFLDYLKTFSLEDLDYYDEIDIEQLYKKANNLEFIWHSLEHRYKDRPDKNEIVKKLMEEIVQLFEFSLIVRDIDRNAGNYQIEEDENEFGLIPYYDYDNIITFFDLVKLPIETKDYCAKFSDTVSKYIWYTPSENTREFEYKIENLTREIIERFLNEIIKENSKSRSEKIRLIKEKNNILEIFETHRNELLQVLNENKTGKSM